MISATPQMRVLVVVEPADFRCGIDGLARLCREALADDPFSGALFVFRNRNRKAIKILAYDGQGFWLCHKRLSQSRFRYWPRSGSNGVCALQAHELQVLLRDGDPEATGATPPWRALCAEQTISSIVMCGWVMSRPNSERVDFNMSELEAILEHARSTPLSEAQHHTLMAVLSTLARLTQELEKKRTSISRLRHLLFGPRSEHSARVLKQQGHGGAGAGKRNKKNKKEKPKGHGRNGANAYRGADRVEVSHESLSTGNSCPHSVCAGKVYRQCDPGLIVRIKGMLPLSGTVYELEKLRCSLCGEIFTAGAPEGVGKQKYDETAASMVANLKYGAGFPFYRLEKLQGYLHESDPHCGTQRGRSFRLPLRTATQSGTAERKSGSVAALELPEDVGENHQRIDL